MNNQQDLPLKKDIAARFVPKIVALMVYLGSLCFVFTLFMIHSTYAWEKQLKTHLSLEIPTLSETSVEALQSRVLHVLNQTPGVAYAAAVPQKEMVTLFESLLGKDIKIDQLSLPIVVDVSLNDKEEVDLPRLETHLKAISPYIQLTDHRQWQRQVLNLIQTSVLVALVITVLILCAALATATFATRTSLLIHRQVIEVLSLIGATDTYIAKQFQTNALKQGLFASIVGSFFAFLTFLAIAFYLDKTGLSFAINSFFFSQALCVFALAPFITAFSMMLSVRKAVMKALQS